MRIGIKVGSGLVAGNDGVNEMFLVNLCRQLTMIKNCNHDVFLVTSGAVASDNDELHSRALRASIGQGRLIGKYIGALKVFGYDAAQMLLLAKELNENKKHIVGLFNEAFNNDIIPIVNANDAVNSDELDQLEIFSDNDILFSSLSLILGSDVAIFGTEAPGLVIEPHGEIIRVIDHHNYEQAQKIASGSSPLGYGKYGMLTKVIQGMSLAFRGVKTIIVDGRLDNFALKALREIENPTRRFGTVFQYSQMK